MEITLVAVGLEKNGIHYEDLEQKLIKTKAKEIIGEDSFDSPEGWKAIHKRFAKEIRQGLIEYKTKGSALFIPEELVKDGKRYLHIKNVRIESEDLALYAHSEEEELVDVFISGGYGDSLSYFKSHLGL